MTAWGASIKWTPYILRPCPQSSSLTLINRPLLYSSFCRGRFLHVTSSNFLPRRRDFFSSNVPLSQQHQPPKRVVDPIEETAPAQKRRSTRTPSAKTSLRRVAVEAQRSRDGSQVKKAMGVDGYSQSQTVTAYCIAERFDISKVVKILRAEGYDVDPLKTGLYPQVVHIQVPFTPRTHKTDETHLEAGDMFIFPSGTVVAWAIPESVSSYMVTSMLLPAAENAHISQMETEDLEYIEDPKRENSYIKGDTIVLGTKITGTEGKGPHDMSGSTESSHSSARESSLGDVDTVLAKIAFSSGLARSTKLAVLETLLSKYFDSTRSIPTLLSKGSRLRFTRSFILRKTGQLLSVRAQLNLYSELTDSLPDLFWDSRHELGLEGYYDQVGRALDVGIRIKTLNERMDYAQEMTSVLRERLSEKHGLVLEWMIIALIAVEVGFEIRRLLKERKEEQSQKARLSSHM